MLTFAIALELNLDQTEDLLERAGFALSHSRKFDVIIEYFIASGKHDIYQIRRAVGFNAGITCVLNQQSLRRSSAVTSD